jgi:elongation factor P
LFKIEKFNPKFLGLRLKSLNYSIMASATEIKKGLCMVIDGNLWVVVDFLHVKPGKGPAFVRTKLKNVKSKKVVEQTIPAGHSIETARVERRTFQYLYNDETGYHFMNTETFDQVSVDSDMINNPQLLKEGQSVEMLLHAETEETLTVELPMSVNLLVTQTYDAVAGNTATNATKEATVETGAKIQVPMFVNEGDTVKINTDTCSYMERIKA